MVPISSVEAHGQLKDSELGQCLHRCLQVLGGQEGILFFVPATSLLALYPTKPCSCALGTAGEDVSPGDHHHVAEQEPAPVLPVQRSANTPGRICPSSLPPSLCRGARRGPWSQVLTLTHHTHEALAWPEQVLTAGGACWRGTASGASAEPGSHGCLYAVGCFSSSGSRSPAPPVVVLSSPVGWGMLPAPQASLLLLELC